MSSFPVVEVAIGLSFTYLLLALVTTTITEWITRITNARGQVLVKGISQLLGDDAKGAFTTAILDHPLIKPLGQQGADGARRTPSYIPASLFSRALADIVNQQAKPGSVVPAGAAVAAGAASSAPVLSNQLQAALQALQLGQAPGAAAPAGAALAGAAPGGLDLAAVEQWYDEHMERVSGWYKRQSQTIVLVLAVAIVLLTNASSISLAERLWTDAPLRAAVVESAKVRLQQGPPVQTVEYEDPTTPKPTKPIPPQGPDANHVLPEEQQLIDQMLGWSGEQARFESDRGWWAVSHLLGWLITAFAVSLGAPFWFDTLNKVMSIRSAGRSPKEAAAGK